MVGRVFFWLSVAHKGIALKTYSSDYAYVEKPFFEKNEKLLTQIYSAIAGNFLFREIPALNKAYRWLKMAGINMDNLYAGTEYTKYSTKIYAKCPEYNKLNEIYSYLNPNYYTIRYYPVPARFWVYAESQKLESIS